MLGRLELECSLQANNQKIQVTALSAQSLRFFWFPQSNSEYSTTLLNKILFRRSVTSKEEGQLTVSGTLLSSTKVTNCVLRRISMMLKL